MDDRVIPMLLRLRIELLTAVQVLDGKNLEYLKETIAKVQRAIDLKR